MRRCKSAFIGSNKSNHITLNLVKLVHIPLKCNCHTFKQYMLLHLLLFSSNLSTFIV